MKKITTFKKMMATALMVVAGSLQSFADTSNGVWVRALTYPAEAGFVYVDFGLDDFDESMFAATSEFKRVSNMSASDAFILAQPAEGWLFAGIVRDMDMNGEYNPDNDKQIWVFYNNYFTAFYDHTDYSGQSTSEADAKALEALNERTTPTDQVIAVFTQGAAAYRAEDEEAFGKVYCSNLANEPGDVVTFSAYGDYDTRGAYNVYYKFDSWLDANGNEVSRDREFTVTVKGMERYYAHFVKTTKQEYQDVEYKLWKEKYQFDYNNSDWNPNGIKTVNVDRPANNRWFDLQGRQYATPRRGLYIHNGRKVFVK